MNGRRKDRIQAIEPTHYKKSKYKVPRDKSQEYNKLPIINKNICAREPLHDSKIANHKATFTMFPKIKVHKFFDTCSNFHIKKTLFQEFNRLENQRGTIYMEDNNVMYDMYGANRQNDPNDSNGRPGTRSTFESQAKLVDNSLHAHFEFENHNCHPLK